MDRKTKSLQSCMVVIESIFELPQPRRLKCETLFELTRRVRGNVVELGTFHGNGAITMCLAKAPGQLVFTVDDYAPKTGWSGESYGPDDKMTFLGNCEKAVVYPVLVNKSFTEAAKDWEFPVDLLFWDAGQDAIEAAMKAWFPLVSAGGIIALHDTYTHLFRARDYITGLIDAGKVCQYEVMPGGVHVGVKV